MRTITTLTETIMEIITGIITEVMDTTHMAATAAVIGMAGITMATITAPDITRAIRLSSSDCRFPSLSRSPLSETRNTASKIQRALEVSLGGIKTLIHRLRKRYHELLREEVTLTVIANGDLYCPNEGTTANDPAQGVVKKLVAHSQHCLVHKFGSFSDPNGFHETSIA
jgi:hypothetical protein